MKLTWKAKLNRLSVFTLCLLLAHMAAAQTRSASGAEVSSEASALPRLVRFNGTARDLNGKPLTGVVGITFALYAEQTGGTPLFLETQNAQADSTGHYSVLLGSTKPDGLPSDIFASEQARWIGVQIEQQVEQPRTLLVSAPYALKAGDAETLGGFPASAFVLASSSAVGGRGVVKGEAAPAKSANATPRTAADVTTSGGTLNTLALFSAATNIQNSAVTQTGTGATAKIGIGTTTPTTVLDVKGGTTVRGTLVLPATAAATAAKGANSAPQTLVASAFNSTSSTALNQTFQLQAEPVANDTTSPSATLNLLYGQGATAPSETGLKISSKGLLTFATGQTFPGTGAGTITGITTAAGSGLTGGGVKGTLTLSVPAAGITNAMLAHPSLTVSAGTGLTGGGVVALGSTITLNVNTAKIPQLGTPNTFVGNQTVTGTVTATSFTGSGAGLTNVIAANSNELGGLASSAYAQLAAANTFTGTQTVNGTVSASSPATALIGNSTSPIFAAVSGGGPAIGVFGNATGASGSGVYGIASGASGSAVFGTASGANGSGVFGTASGASGSGVYASGATGVTGMSTGSGPGASFTGFSGPAGSGLGGTDGIAATGGNFDPDSLGEGGAGVVGTGGTGVRGGGPGGHFTGGSEADGIDAYAGSGAYAGTFEGDVNTTGAYLVNGLSAVEIDNPLDPANKYLVHSSVESSEMKNIYDGKVTTDSEGHATVQLPEWFEALNTDFRYQLTVIGQFAQAIVAREIENNQFEIRTSAPNVKVSWQVTGVRQDAYAKAHPLVVEPEKEARLRGFYTHPELYGAPDEKQIEWARHPQMMKRMKEMRARQLAAAQGQRTMITPGAAPKPTVGVALQSLAAQPR